MSPKLKRHLAQRGIECDEQISTPALLLQGAVWAMLAVMAAENFVSVPEAFHTACAIMVQLFIAFSAGAEVGLTARLRRLSRSSEPIDRSRYVRMVFSPTAAMTFFASKGKMVRDVIEVLLTLAILLSGDHYVAIAFLIVLIYANDRVFEENIEFVERYASEVEAS